MSTASFLFTEPLSAVTPLAWGYGYEGQLGDGNFYTSVPPFAATPVQVSGVTTVTAIAGGGHHSLALSSDGTVWAWGGGVATPVQVSSLSGVVAIAAGFDHSLALKSDGTVWVWSSGDVTTVQVNGLTTVTAIAAGFGHSLALKSDGTVWEWGNAPDQVIGLTTVTAIACGIHSLALKSDGTVWAWGAGDQGQLGDGNNSSSATPVQVSGLITVSSIAAGSHHSLALKSDGTVWAWGYGVWGQLGDGSFSYGVATPVQVSGLTTVTAIEGGWLHSLALKSDGTVWAWGAGSAGQLGNGNSYDSPPYGVATPILVGSLGQPMSAIAAGGWHNLALPVVSENTPLIVACPSDVNLPNDPSQCSAIVYYTAPLVSGGTGNLLVVCHPPSGSVFPAGTTTVTCTATDAAGNNATCSFNVTVNDAEPPVASYVVVKAPVLLEHLPRIVGSFQLLATDNCDPDPLIYIKGSAGSFVAGPFHNGDQVEIGHGPRLIPRQAPSTFGGNIATIQLNGDALLWAVDFLGNVSTPIKCK